MIKDGGASSEQASLPSAGTGKGTFGRIPPLTQKRPPTTHCPPTGLVLPLRQLALVSVC